MWNNEIDTTVLSRLRSRGNADLKKKYADLTFTDDNMAAVTPKFPTVFYLNISSPERGQTLDGKTVNAVLHSVQIEVTDNGETNLAVKTVMNKMCDYMKDMGYEIVSSPEFRNTTVRRQVARFRRMVGANDVI